jgi:micrococcal nuclease
MFKSNKKGRTILRKRKKASLMIILTFVVAITFIFFPEEPQGDLAGPYPVTRVVDGDTIIVAIGGQENKVRLIGIDTPESIHSDESQNVPYGEISSDFTRNSLESKMVYLEYDVEHTDQYGRVLAYVWLDDVMFNKTLLMEGHAVLATYPPNVRYVDEFTLLQTQARNDGKGLWADEIYE